VVPFFLAHAAFWALLIVGAAELGARRLGVFVALWGAGYLGSAWVPLNGDFLFVAYVAGLDVVLVLMVFKGDVALR
jgi:hypothetical protein